MLDALRMQAIGIRFDRLRRKRSAARLQAAAQGSWRVSRLRTDIRGKYGARKPSAAACGRQEPLSVSGNGRLPSSRPHGAGMSGLAGRILEKPNEKETP